MRFTGPCARHAPEAVTRAISVAEQSGSQQQFASHFFALRLQTQEQSNFVQGLDVSTQLQPGGGLSIDVKEEPIVLIDDHTGYCAAACAMKKTDKTLRILILEYGWQ